MNTVLKSALRAAAIASVAVFGLANIANAGVVTYDWNERALFEGQLGQKYTEDFENPAYHSNGDISSSSNFQVFSDARMNEISPEIGFRPSNWANRNLIISRDGGDHSYCAGCNGSFELDFTSTSLTQNGGVFGVGLNVMPSSNTNYFATVLFADNTVLDFALSTIWDDFWGIISDIAIAKIHFGLQGGQPASTGAFEIDNVTFGSKAAADVPAPAAFLLMLVGLAGIGAIRRKAA